MNRTLKIIHTFLKVDFEIPKILKILFRSLFQLNIGSSFDKLMMLKSIYLDLIVPEAETVTCFKPGNETITSTPRKR